MLGLDAEGNVGIVHGQAQGGGQLIEYEPVPDGEVLALCAGHIVGLEPHEIALAIPETVFLRYGFHVVGGHEMVLVLPVDPADAGDVAGDGHLVVRDALGHPYGAHLVAAAADDFEGPYFFLIGHRQALAGVAVAVFLGGFAHQADGVTGIVAAHERQAGEFLDEEHRVLVDEGVRTREGGLAHGQLFLIQAGIACIDIGISMADFRDFAHLPDSGSVALELRVPEALKDFEHVAFPVVRGGFHRNPGV